MDAIRKIYDKLPATIDIPSQMHGRRGEVIMIVLDNLSDDQIAGAGTSETADLVSGDFFGSIPDLPEREPQGEYEIREEFD